MRADLWIWSLEFEFGVWIVAIGGLGYWGIGVLEYWSIGDWREDWGLEGLKVSGGR